MRLLLFFTIVFFVNTTPSYTQNKRGTEEQKVRQVLADLFQSLSDRDIEKLEFNSTTDIIVLEHGIIWNMDTLKQKIEQSKSIKEFSRINTLDFISTDINKKLAWVSYYNQADILRNGQKGLVKWLESAVLIKENKRWKVKFLHSTLIKRT